MATCGEIRVRVRTLPGFVSLLWAAALCERIEWDRAAKALWWLAKKLVRVKPATGAE
jgi:hypothetical protein